MKRSLRKKIAALLIVFALILSMAGLTVSNRVIGRMLDERYQVAANELAATLAVVIDAETLNEVREQVLPIYNASENRVSSEEWGSPEFNAYVAQYEHIMESESFLKIRDDLRRIQDVNDVDCLYAGIVDPVNRACIYLVDASYEDACMPGVFDPLYDINIAVTQDPTVGFPAYITNTEEYGWLVTAGAPVYLEDEVIGYTYVDISMDIIKAQQRNFTLSLIILQAILTLVITFIAMTYVNRSIVKPVNMLSEVAAHYTEDSSVFNNNEFEGLDIHTGDEIETLHSSIIKMEKDINTYINNLMETRAQLSFTKEVADRMNTLAHTDGLTGIRNKLAYDKETSALDEQVSQGFSAFGIAMVDLNDLKKINDTYGHDVGNVAINKLCQTICNCFKHSPVFRIGGDEFAVILSNDDYRNAEKVIGEFNAAMHDIKNDESLDPGERISAAIGYSLFDPAADKCTDDVFKRADQVMYDNKRNMKLS